MTKTALVTTTIVITLGIYDLSVVALGGVDASVSRFLLKSGMVAPLIPFSIGFICGHLFGRMSLICDKCKKEIK